MEAPEGSLIISALDPVKGKAEAARSHSLAREARHQVIGEPFGGAGEIGGIGDRLGEAEAHPPNGRLA